MSSRNVELPFFPQFETEHVGGGAIRVTWFEPKFSQSHYNVHNRTSGSNACTLIAILMASKCHDYNVVIKYPQENLNIRLIHLLAISMLEGNKIHEELKKKKVLKDLNLNVPEALKYTQEETYNLVEWKSSIYMERLSRSLCENIRSNYKEWLKLNKEPNEDLYVVLIADSRTVLFLFQTKTDTISLVDSHQHSVEQGAFVAIANRDQLGHLCFWFKEVVRKCYNSDPKLYELSFLHFKQTKK
ncbi:uncharacterized protein LOC109537487 [Dendroctonus ponderosae]|uniref:Uncharacterized protein n=1 Tax=Dendroctonus ponderosae TaxID=77166 RepID=J3JWL8_DENPD